MKKLLFIMVSMMFASTSYASTYECYRYVGGEPTGTWINVEASSKSEAETIALIRFKELGGAVDSVNCH